MQYTRDELASFPCVTSYGQLAVCTLSCGCMTKCGPQHMWQVPEAMVGLQERWKFADLQKQTDQPAVWLKEILQGIGVLNRKGPNMGLWELQREYRQNK